MECPYGDQPCIHVERLTDLNYTVHLSAEVLDDEAKRIGAKKVKLRMNQHVADLRKALQERGEISRAEAFMALYQAMAQLADEIQGPEHNFLKTGIPAPANIVTRRVSKRDLKNMPLKGTVQ